jgi:hypothetical protein
MTEKIINDLMKIGENKVHPDENTIEINLNGDQNGLSFYVPTSNEQKDYTTSNGKERQKINTTYDLNNKPVIFYSDHVRPMSRIDFNNCNEISHYKKIPKIKQMIEVNEDLDIIELKNELKNQNIYRKNEETKYKQSK